MRHHSRGPYLVAVGPTRCAVVAFVGVGVPTNVFKEALSRIGLEEATMRAARTSDMLPARPDDGVAGSVGKRFSESIGREVADGLYRPSRAHFVSVPKPGFTTRPAAVVRLADRVMYDALVHTLRDRVDAALPNRTTLFWPRGDPAEPRRWAEFISAPLQGAAQYVVTADIAGFYESIDHGVLCRTLLKDTGRREVVEALEEFLLGIMGRRRGIPQGLEPSDLLATAYLAPVDAEMLREGFQYHRNGDDIRVAAPDWNYARHVLAVLEQAVRSQSLFLNSSKSQILRRETYQADVHTVTNARKRARDQIVASREEELRADHDQLGAKLQAEGLGETAWEVFYHGRMSIDQAIEELRKSLEPKDLELAQALFDETMAHAPGSISPIPSGQFHAQLVDALRVLQAARSPHAVLTCANLLTYFPDETELVARYLLDVGKSEPELVARVGLQVMQQPIYKTSVQWAWLFRILATWPAVVDANLLAWASNFAMDVRLDWLAEIEAVTFLSAAGALHNHTIAATMWRDCPEAFRADLVASVARMRGKCIWAEGFLAGAQQDPVLRVVLKQT